MDTSFANAFLVSVRKYEQWPPEFQQEFLRRFLEEPLASEVPQELEASELVRFNERHWMKFLEGVGPKIRMVLEELAELPSRFNVGELLRRLRARDEQIQDYGDLRGVQAGLTKRTRTISKRDDLALYASIVWDDDDLDKCITEMHPDTHAALRAAFAQLKRAA